MIIIGFQKSDEKSLIFFDFFMDCVYNWVREIFLLSFIQKMKNKNSLLKFWVMVASVITFWLSFSSATLFHLEINTWSRSADEIALMKSEISTKIMPIHFADNWNDFGWFFYFSNGLTGTENNIDKTVEINGDEPYKCNNLVRWYYYNAERWERLWPLDEDTKNTRKNLANSQWDLDIDWWLYTVCTTSGYDEALAACWNGNYDNYDDCIDEVNDTYKSDDYWYYWYLKHSYKWQEMALVAGVDYDATWDKFVTIDGNSKFSPTFIRYLNQNPVWFIYDYNWWIWLVWCKFKRPPVDSVKQVITTIYNFMPVDLSNIFQIVDDKITVTSEHNYDKFIDCSDFNAVWSPVLSIIIEWIVWLSDEKKVWYIGNPKDDKMQYFSTANIDNNTLVNYAKKKAEILCRWKWKGNYSQSDANKSVICIDDRNNNTSDFGSLQKGKTYIIKNRNVVITPESNCTETAINDSWYNLLIINWNLKINENWSTCVFTWNGFPRGSNTSAFESAVLWSNGEYDLSNGAAVWSYFNWNFIIDGYITGNNNSELEKKYFVYWKITSKDDFGDILSTFSWRCNDWIATDGTYCPSSLYQSASLVVIDRNYDSPLLKN